MAAIDYYEDSSQYGNYQYITLEQIVNNYMMSLTDNNYTFGALRRQVLYHARRCLREFYYDVLREVKGIEMELSPSLTMTLPPDYVSYVRISWVDTAGQLHPMSIDNRISIAQEYLQDNNYELLFDNNGCVLIGESNRENLTSSPVSPDSDIASSLNYSYSICDDGFRPNLDTSRIFINGKYRIDKNRGIIAFGSNAEGKNVVLEYISDGLFTECDGGSEADIKIHKFAESATLAFIYNELIKGTTAPFNEKRRASKEYYNLRRLAKLRINPIRKDEILKMLSSSSKWVK